MNWYYAQEGRSMGPVSVEKMAELVREGVLGKDSLIWHSGLDLWDSAAKLNPDLFVETKEPAKVAPTATVAQPTVASVHAETTKGKPSVLTTIKASSAESNKSASQPSDKEEEVKTGFFSRLLGRTRKA